MQQAIRHSKKKGKGRGNLSVKDVGLLERFAAFFPAAAPRCGICDEPFGMVHKSVAGGGSDSDRTARDACIAQKVSIQTRHEHFNKPTCGHWYCKGCLTTWVNTTLGERMTHIRCPEMNCKCVLYADDVERLAGSKSKTLFNKLRLTSYKDRLIEVVREREARGNKKPSSGDASRPCPRCYVILHRYQGCSDMLCCCGHRFGWSDATWPKLQDLLDKHYDKKQATKCKVQMQRHVDFEE